MWHNQVWDGPWMMGWGFFPILIFCGLILVLFFYTIKAVFGSGYKPTDNRSLSILKERLARGEIDEAEYDKLHAKLSLGD